MKTIVCLLIACLFGPAVSGQDFEAIKVAQKLTQHLKQDTTRVNLLNSFAANRSVPTGKRDTFAREALAISQKFNYVLGEGYALINLIDSKLRQGDRGEAARLLPVADSIATKARNEELHINLLRVKSLFYHRVDNKKALAFAKEAENKALKTGDKRLLSICQHYIASLYGTSFNNYPEAIEYGLKAVVSGEEADCLPCLERVWGQLGAMYSYVGDHSTALSYYKKAKDVNSKLGNQNVEQSLNNNIGEGYRLMGKYREAIPYYKSALSLAKDSYSIGLAEGNLADVYTHLNDLPLAFKYALSSLAVSRQSEDNEGIAWIDAIIARIYLKKGMADSAVYYAKDGLDMALQSVSLEYIRDNAGGLANAYALKKDFENAYNYHLIYINYRDSMVNTEISNKSSLLQYNYDLAKKQAQISILDQQKREQKNWLISALIVLLFILVTVFALLRSNSEKQKANTLLNKQKLEIEHQRDQTDKALTELQQMQAQLIQSEKMASLGELTAGIAHEIQNPLNFVNNFSEINAELIEELKDHLSKGLHQEAIDMAEDIGENERKIIHHGKRADAIVKGMLQHSRTSSGQKELTSFNALADEYSRLAYHGLRAKDKASNATLQTDYDDSIGMIDIIPQDIGRVILNLITNAFYAVNEREETESPLTSRNEFGIGSEGGDGISLTEGYEPTVTVTTRRLSLPSGGWGAELTVTDNGNGIPQHLLGKIFQPFFTTKPTGQGTGLGLSLSYDIVKAHGGELKVETKQGEGSTFSIIFNNNI